MPSLSSLSRAASTGRAERMGPTCGASWDWKVTNSRVRPPSTRVSATRSAWLRPAWGNEPGALSTLTDRAGRAALAALVTGRPVRGYTAGVVVLEVTGAAGVTVAAPWIFAEEQPARATAPTTSAARARRRVRVVLRV